MDNEVITVQLEAAQVDSKSTDNSRTLLGIGNIQGKEVRRPFVIDFDNLGIDRGGLLEEAIEAQPSYEIALGDMYHLKAVLELCKEHRSIRSVLSRPIASLETIQIHNLFREVEDAIDLALVQTGRYQNGYMLSNIFRRVLSRVKTPLRDGFTLKSMRACPTKYQFVQNTPRPIVSENIDPGDPDPRYAAPITAMPLNRGEKPANAALDHMEHRSGRIISACWQDINYALKWRGRINKLKNAPLSEEVLNGYSSAVEVMLHKQTRHYNSLSPYNLLHLYAHYVEEMKLHELVNAQKLLKESVKLRRSSDLFDHYPKLVRIADRTNFYSLFLIDRYLPNRVVLCIRHLFQMRFALNVNAVINLTRDDIREVEDGYEIRALKGKTDQFQIKHVGKEEQDMIRLIKLLLKNDENIDRFWHRDSGSLFIGWLGTPYWLTMGLFNTYYQHEQFISQHKLPRFSFDELRDQAADTEYLKHRDPHRVQAILGHAGLADTSHYLDQGINRLLSELDMEQFMKVLAPSIVWAVAGEDAVAKYGFDKGDVDSKLLFPVSDVSAWNETAKVVVDEWLQDQNTPIVLTRSRIAFVIRQWRYYRTQWQRIYSDNPERFKIVHLPRLVFAQALCQIIAESEHAELFNELKRKLDPELKEI